MRFERIVGVEGRLIALIAYSRMGPMGLEFFTSPTEPAQMAYMRHPSKHIIHPHYHPDVNNRTYSGQPEALFVQSGRVRVDFYDIPYADTERPEYIKSIELVPGDVVLILTGGHGFEILDECEIVEVRMGQYKGNPNDKVRFDPSKRENIHKHKPQNEGGL